MIFSKQNSSIDKKKNKILHIDTSKSWRGGQQQVIYLHSSLHKKRYQTILLVQPNSSLENYCIRNKLPYQSCRMRNEIDIYAAYKISKFCKKNSISLLHLHTAHALSIGLLTKCFMKNLKLIGVRRVDFHIHNCFSRLYKYNNPLLNKIVCISDGIKKILLDDEIKPNKLITIHSGIDIHKFDNIECDNEFRLKYKIPNDDIIVGTVAAIVDHKDYQNLISAAKIVLEKKDNVTFIALGEGELEEKMKKQAKDFNISNKFHFLGFHHAIGSILKNFTFFVMSSKWEGLGTSILDAQSVGLPVIATRTGGIPEIIKHNQNGLLVSPGDSKELANAILFLTENPQLQAQFSKVAKQSVKDFDISRTVQKNIDLYKELLCESS